MTGSTASTVEPCLPLGEVAKTRFGATASVCACTAKPRGRLTSRSRPSKGGRPRAEGTSTSSRDFGHDRQAPFLRRGHPSALGRSTATAAERRGRSRWPLVAAGGQYRHARNASDRSRAGPSCNGSAPSPGSGCLVSQRQDELDLRGRQEWTPALPSCRATHPLHPTHA